MKGKQNVTEINKLYNLYRSDCSCLPKMTLQAGTPAELGSNQMKVNLLKKKKKKNNQMKNMLLFFFVTMFSSKYFKNIQ